MMDLIFLNHEIQTKTYHDVFPFSVGSVCGGGGGCFGFFGFSFYSGRKVTSSQGFCTYFPVKDLSSWGGRR